MDLRTQIKQHAKTKGIPMWKIAKEYGLSDSNFSRMLRYDDKISENERKNIYEIIERLATEK